MIAEILFMLITVAVLMIGISVIKKYANPFFNKIAKFIPLLTMGLAFVASLIFNKIKTGDFLLPYATLYGYFIASTEVYTYEGVGKLIKKIINYFKKDKKELTSNDEEKDNV